MTSVADSMWFEGRTRGAPEALRERAAQFLAAAGSGGGLVDRLAAAGRAALAEASRDGARREAALDLLAADALITLALLRAAEREPSALGGTAADLRHQATVAS